MWCATDRSQQICRSFAVYSIASLSELLLTCQHYTCRTTANNADGNGKEHKAQVRTVLVSFLAVDAIADIYTRATPLPSRVLHQRDAALWLILRYEEIGAKGAHNVFSFGKIIYFHHHNSFVLHCFCFYWSMKQYKRWLATRSPT